MESRSKLSHSQTSYTHSHTDLIPRPDTYIPVLDDNVLIPRPDTHILSSQGEMALGALQLWNILYPGDQMPLWNPQCTMNEVGWC